MMEVLISKEQARQFVYECFDVIIRDIKANEEKLKAENGDNENHCDAV